MKSENNICRVGDTACGSLGELQRAGALPEGLAKQTPALWFIREETTVQMGLS